MLMIIKKIKEEGVIDLVDIFRTKKNFYFVFREIAAPEVK